MNFVLAILSAVGIFLIWKKADWKKVWKIILTIVLGLLLIGSLMPSSDDDTDKTQDKSASKQEQTVTEESKDETAEVDKSASEESKDEMDSWSAEQKNCYKAAQQYISFMPFSKQGLIDQLSSDAGNKYPVDVAEFAVSKLEERGEVDWDEQCEKAAQDYLDSMAFSKDQLVEQLSSDAGSKFTQEQAERAVEKVYQ